MNFRSVGRITLCRFSYGSFYTRATRDSSFSRSCRRVYRRIRSIHFVRRKTNHFFNKKTLNSGRTYFRFSHFIVAVVIVHFTDRRLLIIVIVRELCSRSFVSRNDIHRFFSVNSVLFDVRNNRKDGR